MGSRRNGGWGGGRSGNCHHCLSNTKARHSAAGCLGSSWVLSPSSLGDPQVEARTTYARTQGDLLSTTSCLLPLHQPLPPAYTQSDKTGASPSSPTEREENLTASSLWATALLHSGNCPTTVQLH